MKNTSMLLAGLAATAFADSPAKIVARQSASASSSGPLPTVTRQGNAFFAGDERFYIRGVDYQPGGSGANSDPLADTSACTRDIEYFQQLGLNTIRVYEVDNTANHDECMSALAAAGIYLALDVNTPLYSLNRGSAGPSYNPAYLQSIFATIDAFATYSNTLLFYSGNEVINDQMTTGAAPYVKAVTRDMKQYIQERGYRNIPVGYSAAAVAENQYLMAQYMDCGDSPASDFYAINNYDWCDPSSFQQAWADDVSQYSNYSLPIFFSEYGCITGDRNFAETSALYSTQMTGVFSGGLVYEYSEEGNGYGLVTISGNTVTPVGSQFSDLQNALSSTSNPSNGGGYREGNGTTQQCPPQSDNWDTSPFTGDQLPATPAGAEKYFRNGAGTGPGLSGAGSQDAPGGSTVTASSGAGQATTTYATQTAQRTATNTVTTGGGSQTSGGSAAGGTTSGAASSVRVPAFEMAPVVCGVVMLFSAMLGAAVFV